MPTYVPRRTPGLRMSNSFAFICRTTGVVSDSNAKPVA
jgi:hypothetical protein